MNGIKITVLFGETTVEQQHECYTLAASAWGSYLDDDEVVAKEKYLRTQSLARDGGCRTWCLYRQDDHSQVISTCKTFRRDFLLGSTEGVSEAKGSCITSVFTALLYRGHGLASYMLQNVAQWLDGPGDVVVSMLYSGIPHFYENLGWTTLPNTEIILSNNPWLQDVLDIYADLKVRSLSDADIKELCAQDIGLLRADIQFTDINPKRSRLTILPKANLVRYQHAFADFMGDLLHFNAPQNRGAAYEDQARLYWYHDFRGRCLYIQRVHNAIQEEERGPDIIAALLLSAFRETKGWNFTQVATWDTSLDVRHALDKLVRQVSSRDPCWRATERKEYLYTGGAARRQWPT
ncbi:hypothetical protein BU25DRAFT_352002 [Macroventuria anomochaeta]|uniref:Uncharacterized protein n=1 Tax=Macroventuria anomochaeta TaxID=301207 RepID=A0ACB6RKR0_9PLEO|nr:uncharacterized protein BU25DRAFT_352002 [Macroventuria anomochaeta]KAF2622596.1 hypothetical protein BU25DRAFT_352002 [Macroventuria anomochaeta]